MVDRFKAREFAESWTPLVGNPHGDGRFLPRSAAGSRGDLPGVAVFQKPV